MRERTPPLLVTLTVVVALVVMAGLRCDDTTDTGHAKTSFAATLRGLHGVTDTGAGWHVVLDQAFAAVGPVDWYEALPRDARAPWHWSLGVALAHPGHYHPGDAVGELALQWVVDLLSPAGTDPGPGTGYRSTANSASFELHAPDPSLGTPADVLHGHALWLRGTATSASRSVTFEGGVDLEQRTEGIRAEGPIQDQGGRWVVAIDLARLLDHVDFGDLPTNAGTATFLPLNRASQPLVAAAIDSNTYSITWQAEDRDP